MSDQYPILEFDDEREAVIEPSKILKRIDIPEHCVLPMYDKVIQQLRKESRLRHVHDIHAISMEPIPIFRLDHEGGDVAVVNPGLGAPFAGAVLEEMIAFGCCKFIACGSAGVLKSELAPGTVIVPSAAVRDEGTSYHYIAPAREIETDPDIVRTISSVLEANKVEFRVGKTWTTDAIYHETRSRVARRKAEGCLPVEMECSALLAVAQFRGVRLGQLLVAGDDASGEQWDPRNCLEHASFHEAVFWLSVQACLKL